MGAPQTSMQGRWQISGSSAKTRGEMENPVRLTFWPRGSLLFSICLMFPPTWLTPTLCLPCLPSCIPDLRPLPLPSRVPSLALLTGRVPESQWQQPLTPPVLR